MGRRGSTIDEREKGVYSIEVLKFDILVLFLLYQHLGFFFFLYYAIRLRGASNRTRRRERVKRALGA